MPLSVDEALGLIGQIEVLKHNINRGEKALTAFVEGRMGMPGEPGVSDIVAFSIAVEGAAEINERMVSEVNDPDGVFGG